MKKFPSVFSRQQVYLRNSTNFLIYFGLIFLIGLILPNVLFSQVIIPYKNFEIKKQKQSETYIKFNTRYRKNDNALLQDVLKDINLPGKSIEEKAHNYLSNNWNIFKHSECFDITMQYSDNDLSDQVVKYNQFYKGLPVDYNQIILSFNRANNLATISQNTKPILSEIDVNAKINKNDAIKSLLNYFGCKKFKNIPSINLIIHSNNSSTSLVYKCHISTISPPREWLTYVDANSSEVVEVYNNLLSYVDGTGRIFDVDPITSSHGTYGQGGIEDNEDANSSSFESLYNTVPLLGITQDGGNYKLKGINAEIGDFADREDGTQLFIQNSSFFDFDRSEDGFEAVMCYYYIDKTLTYAKSLESFSTGPLFFDPHWEDGLGDAGYNKYNGFGRVKFGDGADYSDPPFFIQNVDYAEDAMIILHETGHFIDHSLAGFSGEPLDLNYDGIGEGFGDYWAASEVNAFKQYKDYEEGYNRVFRWANWNPGMDPQYFEHPTTNRKTNTDLVYPPSGVTSHYLGQILSSVLMRIYSDIGKVRTDNIVLLGIKSAGYVTHQYDLAEYIYSAAVSEGYENWEKCIIWNHFDRTYNIGMTRFMSDSPDSEPDLYMKDDVDDVGEEENPTSTVMYLSEDIWVRPTDDNLPYHDNPVYRANSQDKRNFVYVKVRSRGCELATDATLHVYWSKASTGLSWPANWQYSTLNNVVISNEIGTVDLDALNIECGEERIVKLEWTPPNPDDFNDNDNHHYCLLARIVDDEDPFYCTEISNTNTNTRCNNNIIWKNVTVLSVPGYTIDTSTVFVRDVLSTLNNTSCLQISDAVLPHYSNTLDNVFISINLRDSLKTIWQSGGSEGSGFTYDSETGLFYVTSLPVIFCNMTLTSMKSYYLDIYVEGNGVTNPFAFDLKHFKSSTSGTLVGGERFIYPGTGTGYDALPRLTKKEKNLFTSMTVSPNPCSENLLIQFNNIVPDFNLKIYDLNSRLLLEKNIIGLNERKYNLNLSELKTQGVLIFHINFGNHQKTIKVVKF